MSIYSSLKSSGASSAGTTVGLTAPTSPSEGTMWYDTSDSTLYIRTGNVWLEAVATAAGASANPLPVGNISQRPGSPVAGSMRINSETNYFETYYNSNWFNLTYIGLITATSANATVTYNGNYAIHTFLTSGTFTPTLVPVGGTVEFLVVAGGGGGGSHVGGGGGGGGYLTQTNFSVTTSAYTIVVGGGGPGGSPDARGTNGSNSTFANIIAIGGGGGGTYLGSGIGPGIAGGSGGGAGGTNLTGSATQLGGDGTPGQGNKGGDVGARPSTNTGGGGGGGAGAAATNRGTDHSSKYNGGAGLPSTILGNTYYFSGGGGSGIFSAVPGGDGGTGGGGGGASTAGTAGIGSTTSFNSADNGAVGSGSTGGAGAANSGGGGG
ncbi:MAG: hypothetical protein NTU50_07790, partial [Actinobacteria bacterium]|nr:hypothetical protein [Actinomycetota bacterium]